MRRFQATVESRYIPKGAMKVADKKSDAVAYLYTNDLGAPCTRVFFGKQSKPVLAMQFTRNGTGEARRQQAVAQYFASRQASQARKAADRAERSAQGHGAEVGQFLATSWGYDQTNVDFYKITRLVGRTMVELVKVGAMQAGGEGGSAMSDKVIPGERASGEPFRVVMKNGRASVDGHSAHVWDGQPKYRSWYA